MKALEIYKPPFRISEPYIFSSNGVMAFLTYTHQHCIKLQKRGDTTPLSHLPICSRLNIYAALQAS